MTETRSLYSPLVFVYLVVKLNLNFQRKLYIVNFTAVRTHIHEYRTDQMSAEVEEHSGRPKMQLRTKHQKLRKIILNYRKINLIEITEALKISS